MASKEFSNKLKLLRKKAGYTQKQVYEHFNIPQSTFSSWEVGKSEPSGDMLIKLCEFYNCDMMREFSELDKNKLCLSDLELIEKYHDLDEHGKEMVDFTLLKEWERSISAKDSENNVVEFQQDVLNAAHADDYMNAPEELKKLEEAIMDDENF